MFSLLKNVLKNQESEALVLDLPGLSSWFSEQEESFRQEFRRVSGDSMSRILLSYAEIRGQILPLRTDLLFDDDGKVTSAAVSSLLERFENAPSVLFSGNAGDDIAGFCRDAGDVSRCCESCLSDYGQVLVPDYPDLVAALGKESAVITEQVRLMSPAVAQYCARSARVSELKQTWEKLSQITGSVQCSTDEEIRAGSLIATYREQIAAIDTDMEETRTGTGMLKVSDAVRQRQRETVQANLMQSYRDYAAVLLGITIHAEDLAKLRNDDIATGVFQNLREVLAGREVPESDTLFAVLIDAFPIFMDMIEDGTLTLASDTERAVFTDIASFSNGLQDICLCYHEMHEKGDLMSVPDLQTAEERRQNLSREREAILAKVVEESDRILHAHVLITLSADDRSDLVQKIEEGIRKMTGRPVQIRPENPVLQV